MAVLYRKYRPQTFAEVLNQKPIIQTLKNQVSGGSVAHAYLFTGSRGVGKTSVARILAKAVNCLSVQDGDPCGICENCKAIASGSFLDLVEVDAASNTGVDNIRELIEHVKFSPSLGKYKVFIIDEVHMLSKGAFNALLKTLEEPPKHAIFILATTEVNKVPATIISRTQRFDFKALSSADIISHLQNIASQEKIKISDGVLELVAQNAEGSVRDALSLLDKVLTLGQAASLEDCRQLLGITDLKVCEDLLEMIALGQTDRLPDFFSSLSEKGLDYVILNRDFLEFLRKVLTFKVSEGKRNSGLGGDHQSKIKELAQKLSVADLIFIIRLFLKSYKDLASSPSQEIPMLLAAIEGSLKKHQTPSIKSQTEVSQSAPVIARSVVDLSAEALAKVDEVISSSDDKIASDALAMTETSSEELVISLQEAQALWPEVIVKVKEVNGPLASMLKNCAPQSVEGGKIIVAVKFNFDKQSLENSKNAVLISSIVENLSGKKLGIIAQVIKAETVAAGSTAEVLSDALKVFGGELIE